MKRNTSYAETGRLIIYFLCFCAFLRFAYIPLFILGWFGVGIFFTGFFLLFGLFVHYALQLSGIIKTHVKIVREEN